MVKILGISFGTKNGNNDTLCRVALEAAKDIPTNIGKIRYLILFLII